MASLTGALVLAAGKGTRMHSDKPKVLQTLLGEPMLRYVLDALHPLFGEHVWTVIGHRAEMVRKAFEGEEQRFVVQEQQLGTGHALQVAWSELRNAGLDRVVVVNGDTPLLSTQALQLFLRESEGADVAFMTLVLPSPGSYGRVVRHNGRVAAIVEAKDYDEALYGPEPHEINAGIYALSLDAVEALLPRLTTANRSGEYYITDLVGLAVAERMHVRGIECGDDPNLLGVNNPAELIRSETLLRARLVYEHLEAGVVIHAPETVRVSPRATLEPGAELFGPCEIYGTSHIARGAVVHSHCWIHNTTVSRGSVVHAFSHLVDAQVGEECTVGPYARLRPGAVLEEKAHIGNFVEVKKSRVGKGSKANHLTYLGDADIGPGVNVGAGTITCNYDGKNKFRTIIEEGAFIGSNTSLVAPVTVGRNSLVGAGSVITKDVPEDSLGIARGRQTNLPRKRGA